MGAVCQICFQSRNKPNEPEDKKKVKQGQPLDTNRWLTKEANNIKEDKNESIYGRGSNIEVQSNSSVRDNKLFIKTKSTALFSSDGDRRHSSILQFTLDHESIIITGPNEIQSITPSPDQYYTLIDKVAFVKKTMDCIRVTSPDGQSELHCPPQYLFTTLTVSEGRPVESIQEIAPNKVIQVTDSPIKVNLKLKCKSCKKQLKMTSCKGVINIGMIQCSNCDSKGLWSIVDIESNAPIWGDGTKIDNHEQVEQAPSVLRIMGCVICLKFSNCQKMKCGCHLCTSCLSANSELSLDMQCRMCQGSYIL